MAKITRKLTHFTDPGHGWLSVSRLDILALGIQHLISGCSYMNENRVFLEEDGDTHLFMEAAKAAGWDISMKGTYHEVSPIRSKGSYCSEFVLRPVEEGDEVRGSDGYIYKVLNRCSRGGHRLSRNNVVYRVPKDNPYTFIRPCVDEKEAV